MEKTKYYIIKVNQPHKIYTTVDKSGEIIVNESSQDQPAICENIVEIKGIEISLLMDALCGQTSGIEKDCMKILKKFEKVLK